MANYIGENLDIENLMSIIKYQYIEINCKIGYLITILCFETQINRDFSNLIKQIISQIARMLKSQESKVVIEGITMIYNLVKISTRQSSKSIENTVRSTDPFNKNQSIFQTQYEHGNNIIADIVDMGILQQLVEVLSRNSMIYLDEIIVIHEKINNKEEMKDTDDVVMENDDLLVQQTTIGQNITLDELLKEVWEESKLVTLNCLNIIKLIIEGNGKVVGKIISTEIPSIFFKLLPCFV